MRPKFLQLGILPDLDSTGPADYSKTNVNPLNRQVWLTIHDAGSNGLTSKEVGHKLGHTAKSVSGRMTELASNGKLRRTEATRDGHTVFVAVGDSL